MATSLFILTTQEVLFYGFPGKHRKKGQFVCLFGVVFLRVPLSLGLKHTGRSAGADYPKGVCLLNLERMVTKI